ncbi:MAG: hypothetical protein Q8M09_05195 [Pseudomonadota bacterium]|nr:hypothetical protein [Pseudomonadota bacterium]MDP1903631.1 hypothetical protein [Pseudomonadota bacterium]MDP2353901.1 hypothetical protein [Pseudomonadota bacterium]
MLTISQAQMEQIEQARRAEFFRELRSDVAQFMLRVAPEVGVAEVGARIDGAFSQADRLGMRSELQIVRYAYVVAAFPADFATLPEYAWLTALLESPASADSRLDSISAAIMNGQSL